MLRYGSDLHAAEVPFLVYLCFVPPHWERRRWKQWLQVNQYLKILHMTALLILVLGVFLVLYEWEWAILDRPDSCVADRATGGPWSASKKSLSERQ